MAGIVAYMKKSDKKPVVWRLLPRIQIETRTSHTRGSGVQQRVSTATISVECCPSTTRIVTHILTGGVFETIHELGNHFPQNARCNGMC